MHPSMQPLIRAGIVIAATPITTKRQAWRDAERNPQIRLRGGAHGTQRLDQTKIDEGERGRESA
jgi:hypothetical protein